MVFQGSAEFHELKLEQFTKKVGPAVAGIPLPECFCDECQANPTDTARLVALHILLAGDSRDTVEITMRLYRDRWDGTAQELVETARALSK